MKRGETAVKRFEKCAQDLLKFQTLTESEVWDVWGGKAGFRRAEVGQRTSTQIATVPGIIVSSRITFGHHPILSHSQLFLKQSLRPITVYMVYGYEYEYKDSIRIA